MIVFGIYAPGSSILDGSTLCGIYDNEDAARVDCNTLNDHRCQSKGVYYVKPISVFERPIYESQPR